MRIGIDLGDTKFEGIALGDDGGTPVRRRVPAARRRSRATRFGWRALCPE